MERTALDQPEEIRAPDRASVGLVHPELVEAILAEAAEGLVAPVVERQDLASVRRDLCQRLD